MSKMSFWYLLHLQVALSAWSNSDLLKQRNLTYRNNPINYEDDDCYNLTNR